MSAKRCCYMYQASVLTHLLVVLLTRSHDVVVQADIFGWNNNNNNNNHHWHNHPHDSSLSSPFTYSQSLSLDFSSNDEQEVEAEKEDSLSSLAEAFSLFDPSSTPSSSSSSFVSQYLNNLKRIAQQQQQQQAQHQQEKTLSTEHVDSDDWTCSANDHQNDNSLHEVVSVSNSLLYDEAGCCFVSSQAIMRRQHHHQQQKYPQSSFLATHTAASATTQDAAVFELGWFGLNSRSNQLYDQLFNLEDYFDNDDESDDDDDDDDDDGHSSMLSSASLFRSNSATQRRQAVSASGSDTNNYYPQGDTQPSSSYQSWSSSAAPLRQNKLQRHNREQPKSIKILQKLPLFKIRGGGGAAKSCSSSTRSMISKSIKSNSKKIGVVLAKQPIRGGSATVASAAGSEAMRRLIVTALVTLVFEGVIGHILEFLKIVMQTADGDLTYAKAIGSITAEKGIAGLWDGFCPWGILQSVSKGAVFGLAYSLALSSLQPFAEKGIISSQVAQTLAGGIGGGLQGYVLSPTLLLKTRVMTNPVFRESMSLWKTTLLSFRIGADVVASEGLFTLMKGSKIFATKRVFDWGSRYMFSDGMESLFLKLKNGKPLTVSEKSAASLLGGVLSTCVTLPLDVLVAKTQDAKKAGVKVSALQLFLDELQESGWNGLRRNYMRGFEARLAHVCLTTAVVKTGTPVVYDMLYGNKS